MKFNFLCPRCNKQSEVTSDDYKPRVNCGDCLMNDVEIVEMTIVRIYPNER